MNQCLPIGCINKKPVWRNACFFSCGLVVREGIYSLTHTINHQKLFTLFPTDRLWLMFMANFGQFVPVIKARNRVNQCGALLGTSLTINHCFIAWIKLYKINTENRQVLGKLVGCMQVGTEYIIWVNLYLYTRRHRAVLLMTSIRPMTLLSWH